MVSLLRRRAGSGDLILCSQRRQPRVATTARRAVFALFRLGRRHDFSVRRPPVLMQATRAYMPDRGPKIFLIVSGSRRLLIANSDQVVLARDAYVELRGRFQELQVLAPP